MIALLGLVVAGPTLADIGAVGPLALPDLLAPALWIGGLLWIGRLRPAAAGRSDLRKSPPLSRGTFAAFGLAALATFAGGVGLEVFGDALAARFDIGGVVFGATVLAAATSLPELSTGWASAKAGENELAVSDILGGNAVLPVLLTVASLCAGRERLRRDRRDKPLPVGRRHRHDRDLCRSTGAAPQAARTRLRA